MRMLTRSWRAMAIHAAFLSSCATLADSGGGDRDLPNAHAGPFRLLRSEELGAGRTAPHALRDSTTFVRDVSILDADGDAATLLVVGYAARVKPGTAEPDPDAATNELVRVTATDGRSFERSSTVVLTASRPWEGGVLGAPSALRSQEGVWLYYAASGGIGLAKSPEDGDFVRWGDGPVLGPAKVGWDAGKVPRSPCVVAREGGGYRMFFEVDGAIGEATSNDGLDWVRGERPVLEPAEREVSLSGPTAVSVRSSLGRTITWLYVAAAELDGTSSIVAAAREGEGGPFVRARAPVLGGGASLEASEPAVLRFQGFTLLFATVRVRKSASEYQAAVAGAVAPADVVLPPPAP